MQPSDIARAIQGLNYSVPTAPRSLLAPQPATLSQAQPTNRQRLAAAIIGDSAPGSLRRQIAAGLVGDGSDGHSTGLLDYTPAMLGFMDESARKAMTPGQRVPGILELAAGLIPGAAEGVGGLAKSAEKTGLAKVAEDMAKPTTPIVAYHGSPYKFDAFDPSFIGDGEGAQAYGHGLYFAENEKVAQGYRDKLSPGKLVSPADIAEYYTPGRIVNGYEGQVKVVGFRPGPADNPWGWSVDVQSVKPDGTPVPGSYVRNHSTQPDPSKIEAALGRTLPRGGAMYQVGINAPPEHFLDWDAPLSEQPAHLQDAYLGARYNDDASLIALHKADPDLMGRSVMAHMYDLEHSTISGGSAEAAQALADRGVAGIKYLDNGSRNAGGWHITPPDETVSGKWMVKSSDYNSQGMHFDNEDEARTALADKIAGQTRNYVVFSPENIDILKRYGLPAAMGAGLFGAAATAPGQAQAAPAQGLQSLIQNPPPPPQ